MLKDSYVEQAVKAAPGMDYFFKVSIAAALVVAGLPLFFVYFIGFIMMIIGVCLFINFIGDSNMEYEYILTNGNVEIAAIYNASRRKEKLQFDLDNVNMIVPKGSNRINPQEKFAKTYSFVSKSGEGQQISMIVEKNQKKILVTIEPDEKSLAHIKMFAKNKCYDI